MDLICSTDDLPCEQHSRPGCAECSAAWFEQNWPRLIAKWSDNYEAELQGETQECHDLEIEEQRITEADHRNWTRPWQSKKGSPR